MADCSGITTSADHIEPIVPSGRQLDGDGLAVDEADGVGVRSEEAGAFGDGFLEEIDHEGGARLPTGGQSGEAEIPRNRGAEVARFARWLERRSKRDFGTLTSL